VANVGVHPYISTSSELLYSVDLQESYSFSYIKTISLSTTFFFQQRSVPWLFSRRTAASELDEASPQSRSRQNPCLLSKITVSKRHMLMIEGFVLTCYVAAKQIDEPESDKQKCNRVSCSSHNQSSLFASPSLITLQVCFCVPFKIPTVRSCVCTP
jgi:hypothetical protein